MAQVKFQQHMLHEIGGYTFYMSNVAVAIGIVTGRTHIDMKDSEWRANRS